MEERKRKRETKEERERDTRGNKGAKIIMSADDNAWRL